MYLDGGPTAKHPPFFVRNPDGTQGIMRRKCTADHKVAPINQKIRELVGLQGKRHMHLTDILVLQTFGISWDEVQRMRSPVYPWIEHDYPLVDTRTTRATIIATMKDDDRFPTPVRSACFHCPYHGDDEWRYLRDNEPEAFEAAIRFDQLIRSKPIPKLNGTPFLHRSLQPLEEIDFDNAEDKGQGTLFDAECEGMCGL